MSLAEWDDDYAKLARAASQLRTTGGSISSNLPMGSRESQVESIRTSLESLFTRLDRIESSSSSSSSVLTPAEAARRRNLLRHLSGQLNGDNNNGGMFATDLLDSQQHPQQPQQQMSATAMALRQQDDMIDDLALGVGRLKQQSHMINDEANMHVRLIEEMDGDVEKATAGMEAETRRAMKLREDRSVWRLYAIIGVLSVLLVLLILFGLT